MGAPECGDVVDAMAQVNAFCQTNLLDLSTKDATLSVMIVRVFASAFLLVALAGCTSRPDIDPETGERSPNAAESAVNRASDGFGKAATAPLDDLNLRRAKIPEIFKTIDNPYNIDPNISCERIAGRVDALTAELGRDFDMPPPDKKKLDQRAAEGASTAFLDAVASGATGLIPYRGVVRTLSGANAHSRKVLKAYERASHQRTYLKGLGIAKGCEAPAAPLPAPEIEPKVVFK